MPSSSLVEVEVEVGVEVWVEIEATFTGGWVGGVEKLRLELTSAKLS